MHINKINIFYFIIYHYSLTRFGRFCRHHQGVIQEYKNTFYTFCVRIYKLFVFLYDTPMMVARATDTCQPIEICNKIYFTGVHFLVCYITQTKILANANKLPSTPQTRENIFSVFP
jgi:hypothetical protein